MARGSVFVNCPFDEQYRPLLRPLLFTILWAGYTPRIASERSDSGETRISKLCNLIANADAAIHDLSRLRPKRGEHSRLNMAFELGLSYGFRQFAGAKKALPLLVLEQHRYNYMKALSDFSGMDIKSHDNEPVLLVQQVRNWFVESVGARRLMPGTGIWYAFNDFMAFFHDERLREGYRDDDLEFMPVPELIDFMQEWIVAQP